ncbi:hypothetical protein PHYBLDRAFT_160889 [Phycomyces blakesleeanus NRRL 1555(-)]|uniref:L-type lectin-like domain-containing protein n=1 Tax=Phycomyces blakesleeanus (strain ATCC 8743b / DSM 1359 / FGSC 10004 / NBRC 33097 / NRRL 1555) TaxID=763407 RepID=A0A162N2F7_PHYB8|nr:hypothetical protein PHYBLDRAFT_160889 [Phycomyces blakesleeanus NRRL 1555(-)]OAD65154.1 hypothetical protein PHYBLDRAFT_160889 [Phycomyces blakesleeanus NRRL 1555(-)]|eukprot:XP_018283194.1 hypothetical protein PHYBLDRAFT_160889 [Phycomyces blakesleeanus NRRL 1555(-)]
MALQPCSAGFWDPVPLDSTPKTPAPPARLDYKLSFKDPFYYNGSIPFWKASDNVIKSDDFLRLAPSVPNTRGWVWSERPNPYPEWEAELVFRVTGTQIHGGRGLAFWYTKDSMEDGPVFGSKDKWDGLSIWLDSANPKTHTPTTMVLLNDGTVAMASGGVDPTKHMLGSCSINYRNTPGPAFLRVTYKDKTLTVSIDSLGNGQDFRLCLQKSGIKLPTDYYFGVSAASHSPADDHDVISFELKQLNPPAKTQTLKRPMEDAKIKQGEEFKEIDKEQKKKIEAAEFHIKQMKSAAEGDEVKGETTATLAAIFDTQRRTMENLVLVQMQIEALGAPTPEMLIKGQVPPKDTTESLKDSKNNVDNSAVLDEIKRVASEIQKESEKNIARIEAISQEHERKFKSVTDSLSGLERVLQSLDSRMIVQVNTMQTKMSEMTRESAETKGTMSSIGKYIVYALLIQGFLGVGVYFYWKLRVERNEKKFL